MYFRLCIFQKAAVVAEKLDPTRKLQAPDTESRSLLAELVQVRAPPHRCYAGGVCTGLLNFAVMVTDCFSGLRVSAAHQGVESIWASQADPPKASMGSNSP